ncbi:prolipoprotein diacylglyceryl transferase [Muricauda sp. 334s03]|uniref:Prolipoprotein diacylglyceryl transferase n=1 Tax=Flagellimonas yonaguniensis TaxID=3031325 RepID=A0ABT5Y1S8_9FLAO|nr:DUF6787 family protein [[Muricauda] yonaguniensis]MDF0717261.1 prolipoprotein diacylglyceryl transferase [[Muricauda] yonaguniensis]
MQKLKQRWEIQKNWQILFPLLGAALTLLTSYFIVQGFVHSFGFNGYAYDWLILIVVTPILYFGLVKFFLWCFKKVENKWKVDYKWEMIAIFIVFALTGSAAGKLAGPLVHWIGLDNENVHGAVYWTLRILLIFPIYQILLVGIGWLFGQYQFFWNFEKKMLKRMGLGVFLK